MARYFQVVSPSPQVIGQFLLYASASSYYNGQCAAISDVSSTPTWIKPNGTLYAQGLFYDQGAMADEFIDRIDLADEQKIDFMAGKRVGVVTGDFLAYLSSDYFNTAPSIGEPIYDAEDGTLTNSGSGKAQVGICLGTNTVEGTTTVYLVHFHFGATLNVG